MMSFEWDENKQLTNLSKHSLNFKDAHLVFAGQTVTFADDRQSYNEPRYITLGTLQDRIVVIIHTYRNHKIRIISMRKANEREQRIYQKRLETH